MLATFLHGMLEEVLVASRPFALVAGGFLFFGLGSLYKPSWWDYRCNACDHKWTAK
jgi:hypothetical protein